MLTKEYRQCVKCIMDTTDPNITFDENGVCDHCNYYHAKEKELVIKGDEGITYITELFTKIKKENKSKKYDCILGVSGGADSSFVAHLSYNMGLRMLLIHFDNGYDTPESIHNIDVIVKKTGFDIQHITMNHEELIDLQLAYLKASVIDIEVITDHGISAVLFKIAKEMNIKYILGGSNVPTETTYGDTWSYRKNDLINLKNIYKKFGKFKKLKTFPTLGLAKLTYYKNIKRIKVIYPLNYVDYNLRESIQILKDEYGWIEYGEKHYESIFTRFYQAYILPKKFGVDKRLGHYSSLICSGQMTREEALKKLEQPLYQPDVFLSDKSFILYTLGLSDDQFQELMNLPIVKHKEYGTDMFWFGLLRFFTIFTRPATFKRRLKRFLNIR